MNKHDIISARLDLCIIELSSIIQIDIDDSKDNNIRKQHIFEIFRIDIHKRVNFIYLMKIHFV